MTELFSGADLRTRTVGDAVYEAVKAEIIRGRLAPGARLVERELCQLLGVSRTPLREALTRLNAEHFVLTTPNGQMIVTPIEAERVEQLYAVRSVLEGLIAREAARRADDRQLERLGSCGADLVQAGRTSDFQTVIQLGARFHAVLYEASGNLEARAILARLSHHIDRYRFFAGRVVANRALVAAEEHQPIYEAVRRRDEELAEGLMRAHILNGGAALITTVRRLSEPESGSGTRPWPPDSQLNPDERVIP